MGLERSAVKNMHSLISFIALFTIILNRALLVSAEVDVEVPEANGKNPHEHDASLTSDVSFLGGDIYSNSDVESVPFLNVSTGRSGKLYNYDDNYWGSLDQYPQYPDQSGNYDYGEYRANK